MNNSIFTLDEIETIKKSGISYGTIYYRVTKKGMTIEQAINYGKGQQNNPIFKYDTNKIFRLISKKLTHELYRLDYIYELYKLYITKRLEKLELTLYFKYQQPLQYEIDLSTITTKSQIDKLISDILIDLANLNIIN